MDWVSFRSARSRAVVTHRGACRQGCRAASALALALLGAGCATYSPAPLEPASELQRLDAVDLGTLRIEYASAGADAARVFDVGDGLDEFELAAVALALNPALRAKRAEIGEVDALLVAAGVLPNPDLSAFVRGGIGGATGTGFGADLLFNLLRPGERDAKRGVAGARADVVRAEIVTAELRLVSDVRLARLGVLAAEQSRRLLEQELALRDETVSLTRRQREAGEGTALALALAELDRTGIERQLRDAAGAVERERHALNAALGVPPQSVLNLAGNSADLALTLVPEPTDADLDARLLEGRGELGVRTAVYREAEEELRLAVARQYPHLALGPSFERDVEGSDGLGAALSLELPMFDRNEGEIAQKTAERERRRAEYAAALHEARAQAYEARAQLHRARADVEQQQAEVLPLVQRTETLFAEALRARELSILEWTTVRARAIQARRDLLDASMRYAAAAVALDSATGAPFVAVFGSAAGAQEER